MLDGVVELPLAVLRPDGVRADDEDEGVGFFDTGIDTSQPVLGWQNVLYVDPDVVAVLFKRFLEFAYEVLVLPRVRDKDAGMPFPRPICLCFYNHSDASMPLQPPTKRFSPG